MKHILLTILLLLSPAIALSQWSILSTSADSLVTLGENYIYNLEYDKAEQCFKQLQQEYPKHPAGYFLDAMIDWWRILVDKDNSAKYNDNFLRKIEKTVKMCDAILDTHKLDINALFFKAGAIGYRGRYYVETENWISAAKDGSTAFDLLINCLKVAPNNHDIMLGCGIYNYFAASIPEKYPIVKPLMLLLPSGDKVIGEMQLKASARGARYASVEAKVALMQLYYTFENKPNECLPIVEELHKTYPNNPYFKKYYARTLVRVGAWTMFEDYWRQILIDCLANKYGYNRDLARESMYYIALALQNKKDYTQALKYYYKCDEGCRAIDKKGASSFMSMTNLNIGKIYDLQGKRELAIKQYNKVLKMDNFRTTHDDANSYIKRAYGG
ncbi:MAG: tetratricopeptide repeat protein [Ignavibacteria bacterium]|jgi:tetratricopeptide (TPR) repeat protein|nr:tetratricopeptide repeat protein [Ignavibacteria bacterium]